MKTEYEVRLYATARTASAKIVELQKGTQRVSEDNRRKEVAYFPLLDAHHREPPQARPSRDEDKANEDAQHSQNYGHRRAVTHPQKDCTQANKDQH